MENKYVYVPFTKEFYDNYQVFQKHPEYPLSNKKISSLKKVAEYQQYYLANPLKFVKDMYNINLLDFQALMFETMWFVPNVLIVASRASGKSTVGDLFIMTKQSLVPNFRVCIASTTGNQSENTFKVIESIANNRLSSFVGSTGELFKENLVVKAASGDGFVHMPGNYSYSLYDGSNTQTLNSNIDARRGIRSECVIFDECGFISEEMLNVYGAFTTVGGISTGTIDGHQINSIIERTMPKKFQNQRIYISSASSVDTRFYKLYREFYMKKLEGDPDYAILHIGCDQCLAPTLHGEPFAPLLSQKTIDTETKLNPDKADREYRCIFVTTGGKNSIVTRGTVTRNEEIRTPVFKNPDGKHKYIIAIDPARTVDNSCVTVGELYEDIDEDGLPDLKVRLVNCVVMVDIDTKSKKMLQIPEQVQYVRQMIVDYDGGTEDYSNVRVLIDAGAGGGGGQAWQDLLMQDFVDRDGISRHGIIDKEYSADYLTKYPHAVNVLKIMEPTKYKSMMYEALVMMLNSDKIKFTATYDNRDYLIVFDDNDALERERKEIEAEFKKQNYTDAVLDAKVREELEKRKNASARTVYLDFDSKLALAQLDAQKEELVNMIRRKRPSGKDEFCLTPAKEYKLHDDRAYTLAEIGYALYCERRKDLIGRKSSSYDKDLVKNLTIRRGKIGNRKI